MHYLNDLNPQQREAVEHISGPLLIIAGAGTGKTKTLTHRIIHIIHQGVAPHRILAITFTNKAAQEMRERVGHLLGQEYESSPSVFTFHALGMRILRQFHDRININKYFTIMDSQDSRSLIKQIMKEQSIDPKMWEPKKIASVISRAKSDAKTLSTFSVTKNPITAITLPIWERYEVLKRESKSLDFADLLSETYFLLRDHADIRSYYQKRWSYIHVDEYQDTNTIQNNIIKLLSEEHQNICAVGDGDQTIYSWRGANMEHILKFEKTYKNAKVILLEKNYRSTQRILQAAHEIIAKNTERVDKKLVTDNQEGEKITVYEAFSAHEEARFVANEVQHLIRKGVSPNDIGVLLRTNFQSRVLEELFLEKSLPYHVVGVKFFDRKEIKDVMAYLITALNPDSLAHTKRVINNPKRGIGKVSLARIFAGDTASLSKKANQSYEEFKRILEAIKTYSEEHVPSELIRFIIQESGFEQELKKGSEDDKDRLENMKELVTHAQKYDHRENALEAFLEEVSLLSDQDNLDNDEQRASVKIMTIHASKGLEFKYVFVVGLEQVLFPSERDSEQKKKHEQEEERRLCYVAFTRAKEKLYLSYAQVRTIYGQQRFNTPSEFLTDLPDHLIEEHEGDEDEPSVYLLDF